MHAHWYIGSDPHIYEEPNPSINEPIYEQVGTDAKVIAMETNEAYNNHIMMDGNAAYETSQPNRQDVHCPTVISH